MASKYTIRGVADMSQHDEQLKKSAAEVYKYEKNVKSASGQLNQFSNAAKNVANGIGTLNDGFAIMNNSTAPLKLKLREITNVLADLEMQGKSNTKEFTQLAQYAGTLSNALGDAKTAVRTYSDDALSIKAATQAMSAFANVGSVATGVMGLLGVENESVTKTLVKVQSAMAVANGLTQLSNNLNKDSALLLKLKSMWTNIATASTAKNNIAIGVNTVATNANTIATKAWNVAKAISKALFGDLTGLILVGAAAIATYTVATEGAKKKEEEEAEALKKTAEAHRKKTDAVNSSVGSIVSKYEALKASWQTLSTEQEKRDWLEKNKQAFQQLGLSVNTLSDAENIFVKDTQRVVNALVKRAEATAMAKLYEEEYLKAYKKSKTVEGGGYQVVHKGGQHKATDFDRIKDDIWKAAGITRADVSETREGLSFRYKLNQSGIDKLNEYERKEALKRKQETFADAEQIKQDYIKKAKEASEATAQLPNYFKGNTSKTTSTSKTTQKVNASTNGYLSIPAISKEAYNANVVEVPINIEFKLDKTKSEKLTEEVNNSLDENINEMSKTLGQIDLDNLFEFSDAKWEKEEKFWDDFGNTVGTVGQSFSRMGEAFKNLNIDMPQIDIMGIVGQSIANIALGFSQAQLKPKDPISWLVFGATGLAEMLAMIAAIKNATSGYANGGIIGGTTTIGDYNLARVNKGEMILNNREQSRLFGILNGNGGYAESVGEGNVQFRISGNDLVGVLNNYNKKRSKVL